MDTQSFFAYPTGGSEPATPSARPLDLGLLPAATEEEWQALLDACQTRRFRTGETPISAGEDDRAFYILADGQLRVGDGATVVVGPSTVGEGAFLDGQPRAVSLTALTDGELLRLSWEDWEALAARRPELGRDLLAELGRIAAGRMRAAAPDGWTG